MTTTSGTVSADGRSLIRRNRSTSERAAVLRPATAAEAAKIKAPAVTRIRSPGCRTGRAASSSLAASLLDSITHCFQLFR
jgi:hypothetical protein